MKYKIIFLFVFIIISLHPYVDAGSDSDDAIEISWKQILNFKSPYTQTTHLKNKITPTIGYLILCLAGYKNAELLGIIAVFILYKISRGSLAWMLITLISTKTICQGIDYLYCSSILVVLLLWVSQFPHDRSSTR